MSSFLATGKTVFEDVTNSGKKSKKEKEGIGGDEEEPEGMEGDEDEEEPKEWKVVMKKKNAPGTRMV